MVQQQEDDILLTVKETARYLNVSAATLNKMRCLGGGPEFIRMGIGHGARIRYRVGDLKAWIYSRRRSNTSQAA